MINKYLGVYKVLLTFCPDPHIIPCAVMFRDAHGIKFRLFGHFCVSLVGTSCFTYFNGGF